MLWNSNMKHLQQLGTEQNKKYKTMKKLLLFLSIFISVATFSQTTSEISRILNGISTDLIVTGQTGQSTLGNNILLATAGTGSFDAVNNGPVSYRSFFIQVIGTAGISAGQIILEGSNNNTTFVAVTWYDDAVVTGATINTATAIAASTNRFFSGKITYRYFRCRISTAFVGGTVSAIVRYSTADYQPRVVTIGQPTAANLNVTPASTPLMTGMIASAAGADGTANPTGVALFNYPRNFNSSTWDRVYGNYNTTTGDVGAKTTTFNGATQTNFNARGATITVLCGTVTGTSPTLSARLQWSPDAGTTWYNISSTSSNVTATGDAIVFQVYPTNFSVAGATPTDLTTGATQTVQLNTVLPRTWRVAYTIGGTTPSFTLTGVYVNYQL